MARNERRGERARSEHWGSTLGVVLAVAGSAVGLGNFVRFPGLVAKYGGCAFMVPYFLSMLVVAIPLAWTEWALGRRGGRLGFHSTPGIYRAVGDRRTVWAICGGLASLGPFVISMYYLFIEAWCLFYALQYLGGTLNSFGLGGFSLLPENISAGLKLTSAADYKDFFNFLSGATADGSLWRAAAPPLLFATALCAGINYWLVYRGVSKGIERFCKWATPLLVLCAMILIVRIATFGNPTGEPGRGFLDGLGFMWNPTREVVAENGDVVRTSVLSALSNPEIWLAATSQIFFSASLCIGAIATYASCVQPKEDIALSSLTATAANEFCEVVLGGLMVVPPAIMFLGAAALGTQLESSFATGFIVLPNVFGTMPAGQLFGFLFFGLLFLAAITSSISQVHPSVALVRETLDCSRKTSVALTLAVNALGTGIVCWFTKNLAALDAFDFWVAQFGPFAVAILQTSLVVFVWKKGGFFQELDEGARVRVPRWIFGLLKFVSLPYLALIFALWLRGNFVARIESTKDAASEISVGFIVLVAIGITTAAFAASKRWKREEIALKARDDATSAAKIDA